MNNKKKQTKTLILCFFLGLLGVHRFYTGKIATGVLMLLTMGGFGVWYIIDLILLMSGKFEEKQGKSTRPLPQ